MERRNEESRIVQSLGYCCFPSHSRSTITSFSIPAKLRRMECERDFTQTAQFFSGECYLVSSIPFSLPIPRLFSPNVLAKRGSIMMNGRWASCSSNSTRAFPIIPPPSSVKSVLSFPFLSLSRSRLLAASNSTFPPIPFPCLFAQTHHISTAVSFFSSSWMCTQQKSPLSHASTIYSSRLLFFSFPPWRRDVYYYAARFCSTQWAEPPAQRRWTPE